MFVDAILRNARPHHVQLLEAIDLDLQNERAKLAALESTAQAGGEIFAELRRTETEAKQRLAEHAKAGKELARHFADQLAELRRDAAVTAQPIALLKSKIERLENHRGKILRDTEGGE